MKKLLLVLGAVSLGLCADAFVDNQYTASPEFLQNTGYSKEVARMVNVTNQDPYREPYREGYNILTLMKRSLNYIAPGTFTDMDYYNHNGSYNNPSWKDL